MIQRKKKFCHSVHSPNAFKSGQLKFLRKFYFFRIFYRMSLLAIEKKTFQPKTLYSSISFLSNETSKSTFSISYHFPFNPFFSLQQCRFTTICSTYFSKQKINSVLHFYLSIFYSIFFFPFEGVLVCGCETMQQSVMFF